MEIIKMSEFDWIKSNSDIFKKYLYHHYDFEGKKITHISTQIITSDESKYLIIIELHKGCKRFPWFTINSSGGSPDTANVYLSKIYENKKVMSEPKEVRLLKSEYVEGSFTNIFKEIKRNNLLKEILQ